VLVGVATIIDKNKTEARKGIVAESQAHVLYATLPIVPCGQCLDRREQIRDFPRCFCPVNESKDARPMYQDVPAFIIPPAQRFSARSVRKIASSGELRRAAT
jgi:hypothetical protein